MDISANAGLCLSLIRAWVHGTECLSGCGCRVLRAFPVKELVTEDDTINAEMDPEDVFRVTETIQGHHQMT